MATIEVEIEINSTIDKVWEIVSDIDNEPKFWKGTKEVKNISKEGNTINREITIAFRDQKCLQQVKIYPKEKIEAKFTKGIIEGEKIISITAKGEKIILSTYWDIKLTGMMGMFTNIIKKHIKSGTEQAMQSIKEEIER
jgi:ribosome-associated toxin RatA of RatAB toxin-antitoxin module